MECQIEPRGGGRGMDTPHRCIYKIPSYLLKGCFTPRLVSLGPLHHGSPHLQPMEHHKRRALLHFLDRSKRSANVYLKALQALQAVERKLRACYEWPDELPGMESPEFLNMTLLDGCFLLELQRTAIDEDTSGYADDDLVFGHNRADFFADKKAHDLGKPNPIACLVDFVGPLGGTLPGRRGA
ncbi:hypothetical protein AMTR_s00023p00150580 [Amborella trichopoda]|uniref:Uncharacterized protein n=1 Tax=Amborella trichopoda TaxID=13333 RepID=W1NK58_AMBTC|nr:hypothetical protein AMTR_s00023p00150580 [Amborella trichopoda]